MCENKKSGERINDRSGCHYYGCNDLSLGYKRRGLKLFWGSILGGEGASGLRVECFGFLL